MDENIEMEPTKTRRPELLAPAGDMESLAAALRQGADAVYFGAQAFSARANAKNFSDKELREAIDEAHVWGARAYAALNTLLFEDEIFEAVRLAAKLCEYGIDACIVQDVGLAALLRRELPGLELHASTQLCLHDRSGLDWAGSAGFTRAVLSRELPLGDIRALAQSSPIELEVFVHGALCSAFSGGCLFSAFVGGRSGNRGECAQPCRLPYDLGNLKRGHLLSLRDLCLIGHVRELADAGVTALKIEGRMRGPEYVAAVTRAYRNVLDGEAPGAQRSLLESVCHHFGYCTGYLLGDDGLTQPARPESWRMPSPAPPKPRERSIPLAARVELREGMPSVCVLSLGDVSAKATGSLPEAAQSAPLTPERVRASFAKLGGTPFRLEAFDIRLDENLFMPAKALNELRRKALEALCEAVKAKRRRGQIVPVKQIQLPPRQKDDNIITLTAQARTLEQAEAAARAGADAIVFRPPDWTVAVRQIEAMRKGCANTKLLLRLPNVLRAKDWALVAPVVENARPMLDGAVASNPSQAAFLLERFERVTAGHEFNITNAEAALYWAKCGARVTLSPELTIVRIRAILELCAAEIVAYGHMPLMTLLHCPVRDAGGACSSACAQSLTDRKGISFPLEPEKLGSCHVTVRNAHCLDLLRRWPKNFNASLTLLFSDENGGRAFDVTNAYRRALAGETAEPLGATLGRFYAKD